MTRTREPWLFGSFFMGGFECSTHLTTEGRRLDSVAATQHDVLAAEDYALCRGLGIRAVREAARWPMIDRGGLLDLAEVRRLARLGRAAGLTMIWDLMHYGYPEDLDPLSGRFVDRFTRYAKAVAAVIAQETRAEDPRTPTYYTPINEISYYAWAGGQVGYMAPLFRDRGGELKRALARAAIAATDAIWEADPRARILNVDPLVRIEPPPGRPDLQAEADRFNRDHVWQGFDMLAGRLEPELGGSRAHLGIVGLNYYSYNQWTIPTPEAPQRFLTPEDPTWVSLGDQLLELHARYGGPLVLAETGAGADARPGWIGYLARESKRARERGVDLQGVCFYPIVTSPDWEDPTAFFDGGLADVIPRPDGRLERVVSSRVAAALREAQAVLDPKNLPSASLAPEPPDLPEPPARVVRLAEHARTKGDNFSYQTLLAGDSLVVELYTFGPSAWAGAHRHLETEHVLTVVSGTARVRVGEHWCTLKPGETLLVPAGRYHSIHNDGAESLLVQQVSAPKPWDARFRGPHPGQAT